MKKEFDFAKINTLEMMAREYHTKNVSNEEIEKVDITETVLAEIPYILSGEIFNMNIQGKTKSSKSTLMMWFLQYISKRYMGKDLELMQICAEQFEFTRKITDPTIRDTIMGIDEFGAMETSGANATMEEKMLEQFSDLQAQRNIHRIFCSPRTSIDKNSNIMIKIMAKDSTKLLTHCLVYYKVEAPNEWYIQLIGRASFNMSDILFTKESWAKFVKEYKSDIKQNETMGENWTRIRNKYGLNSQQSEFEETTDENGRIHKPYGLWMHPIYHRYRKRKFLKMMLLNKEGIAHMRDMVFADITLTTYDRIKDLCGVVSITKDIIESKISARLREIKYPLTIYAMEVVKGSVNSLITQQKTIQQLYIKMIKTRMGPERQKLANAIEETKKSLENELNEKRNLIRINEEYNGI